MKSSAKKTVGSRRRRDARVAFVAAMAALSFSYGCSGRTTGATGPLATCGDQCTTDQIAASCSASCDKITAAGCNVDRDCLSSCVGFVTESGGCSSAALGYLRCVEGVTPICDAQKDPLFPGCDQAQKNVQNCVNTAPGTGSAGGGGTVPSGTVDRSVCPNIPRPPSNGMACGGGSSSSGSAGSGTGGAAPSCETSCQDGAGDVWASNCAAGVCTCTYNGGSACTCVMTSSDACVSCCPGAI